MARFVFFILFLLALSFSSGDKRLLVNDPDVIRQLEMLTWEVNKLKAEIQLMSAPSKPVAHYTRWGKKTCGANATLIYSGQVGGGLFAKKGNGANPLCLHHEVLWGSRTATPYVAELHGAEYQEGFSSGTFNLDVPCAICKPNTGSKTIMIPGRNTCIPDWNEEYHGYIAASYKEHPHTTMYVCMDENEDVLDAGSGNDDGFLFYNTVARCGSLKCPPYVDGKLVTCVVCSQ